MLQKLFINKTYLFAAGVLLLFLVSYQLAFKNTIAAWKTNRHLKEQLNRQTDVTYQPAYLERKNKNLDAIIAKLKIDSSEFKGRVIATLAKLTEKSNVKIIRLYDDDEYYHTKFNLVQRVDLEGNYFELLKFLDQIEQLNGVGVLRSVDISSRKNTALNSPKLTMTIWMDSIK